MIDTGRFLPEESERRSIVLGNPAAVESIPEGEGSRSADVEWWCGNRTHSFSPQTAGIAE